MIPVWLDVDPGHDDATAIMLALHSPNIRLLGVSSVHGNTSVDDTTRNAARCLHAFGAPPHIRVHRGAAKPLLRPVRHDPEIHGEDGLGGVEGLAYAESPEVQAYLARDEDGNPVPALDGMVDAIKNTWRKGDGQKVTVISSGPMTNIAMFVSQYPDLLVAVEQFVFMGGGVGLGNRSAVAEFNILCDPEATQIVLDAPVKTVMIPINVTHKAIATRYQHARLRSSSFQTPDNITTFCSDDAPLPIPSNNVRHTLSTIVSFFADTYKSTFGFHDGPPLHDPLTIAYVSAPELFKCTRYRVDVELQGAHTTGETVVDLWNYRSCDDTWGSMGKNCLVAEGLDVDAFWDLFMLAVEKCDGASPLNMNKAH
ncbi:uridine nucleosidase [Coniophora puteana RWD-64-598 SS2]|uniref:Uridine nucleosidase n=1 Tax=Coniophora puteana (strain RWD-64-598) TaxID=741705 RepID=A0A5M3MB76_CONPW|nr:uridine nucleosidase [Coniophora puteana RWD-64-598 SS2]EIW76317.1 uridine nucleosidase [Coniophora puteana RWD-64-598 SS2]